MSFAHKRYRSPKCRHACSYLLLIVVVGRGAKAHWLLLVALAQQMRIEFVDVVALFATDVALPRIALAMATLVQEVERFVRKLDATEQAC